MDGSGRTVRRLVVLATLSVVALSLPALPARANHTCGGVSGQHLTDVHDEYESTSGNDTVSALQRPDTMRGREAMDRLCENEGQDHVYGDAGNDALLAGNEQGDHVWGGPGNDTINGGADADVVVGGDGVCTQEMAATRSMEVMAPTTSSVKGMTTAVNSSACSATWVPTSSRGEAASTMPMEVRG
jgi:hemolysin type calcium-binding protein